MGEATVELVAGGIAGAAGIVATQPLDTIRIRLQSAADGSYTGIRHCATSTMRQEGLRGLYKGVCGSAFLPIQGAHNAGWPQAWLPPH